jgi:hypothetical protein
MHYHHATLESVADVVVDVFFDISYTCRVLGAPNHGSLSATKGRLTRYCMPLSCLSRLTRPQLVTEEMQSARAVLHSTHRMDARQALQPKTDKANLYRQIRGTAYLIT